MKQRIRLCTTPDQVRLACACTGQGYPLVKDANWLSHLEFDWQSPVWRHWWEGLSKRFTLIRYDERGCGLSDWEVPEFSFDAWVRTSKLLLTPSIWIGLPCWGSPRGQESRSPTL